MTNFSGSKPRKKEVSIAKNYLNKDELYLLNGLVSSYLEFAELQAKRRKVMSMKDWIKKLDDFLTFSDFEVLRIREKYLINQGTKIKGKIMGLLETLLGEEAYLKPGKRLKGLELGFLEETFLLKKVWGNTIADFRKPKIRGLIPLKGFGEG